MSGKKNPVWDWLVDLLKGESPSPLLSSAEIEYIAEVRSQIIQEAKSSKPYYDDKLSEFKLSILKDNFKKVVDYLRKSTKSKEKFLELYPEWCTVRDASILQLKCIANTIETNRKNCIVYKNRSTLTSLVGGVVCLATGGWFIPLLGSGLIAIGTVANAELSQAEMSSLRKEIEKAKKIIKEDQEHSQKVWNWLSDGSDVQEAVNIINSIDVDDGWIKIARKLQDLFQECHQAQLGKSSINSKIKIILKEFSPNWSKAAADAVGMIMATIMLLKKYRSLFETIKLVTEFSVVQNWAPCIFGINHFVSACKREPLTKKEKVSIGIDMALNVISLLSSAEKMKSGSKEALLILEAADKLKEEAKMYKDLYQKLQGSYPPEKQGKVREFQPRAADKLKEEAKMYKDFYHNGFIPRSLWGTIPPEKQGKVS